MSDRRLIYLTSWRATVYVARGRTLDIGPTFPNDEEGFEAFANYLKGLKDSILWVLTDVVEEDFHLETIPYVRFGDRKALIQRRLAQRYRDTSLALALSLGKERGQRVEERVLLSSFTNTQQFQPWLNVLRHSELPVAGVYSVALMAPALARRLGYGKEPSLVVTLQPAGLRQTLVQGGEVRFSRLGPLDPAEADQPTRVASAFAGETVRIHQYLAATRAINREGPPLDVILVAPPGRRQLVAAAASDTLQLRYDVRDVLDVASEIGLKHVPRDAGAEYLYLYLLSKEPSREQYANERLRHYFRIWQGRTALLRGGAAIFGLCTLVAGWQMLHLRSLSSDIGSEQLAIRAAQEDYTRMTQGFPKIPTTLDNLKLTVQQYAQLQKQTGSPLSLFTELADVMAASPRLELESLKWETAVTAARATGKELATTTPPVRPGPGTQAPPEPRYETLDVSGAVHSIAASDLRSVTAAVTEFVERIKARPGIEILVTKLPYDIGSETALAGDLSAERASDGPATFRVVFGRRLAP